MEYTKDGWKYTHMTQEQYRQKLNNLRLSWFRHVQKVTHNVSKTCRYYGIARDDKDEDVFFHFTAIPGEGYRTFKSGTAVRFEIVENTNGLVARNVQAVEK